MSYAPGAPAAVWALDIATGPKLTLMALWSWADHEDQREGRDCTVWAKRREDLTPGQSLRSSLAIQTCQTERAVRQHLCKLRALGLADASGRCVALTNAWQSCPPRVNPAAPLSDATLSDGDTGVALGDITASRGDTSASLQLNPPVPSVSPSPGDDAGARPDTPSDNPAPEEHTHDQHLEARDGRSIQLDPAAAKPVGPATHGTPQLAEHAAAIRAGDDPRGAGDHRGRGDGASGPARAGVGGGDARPVGPGGDAGPRRGVQGGPILRAPCATPAGRRAAPGRLTPELAEAVAAAGDVWGVQLGQQHFERCVRECVDDCDLTPEELTRGLEGWSADSGVPRSHWLYGRSRRAFLAEARVAEVLTFAPLPGGAVVDTTPFWAKPGFVPEEEVS